jgi:DNA-binding MarR family transcriptional regulator
MSDRFASLLRIVEDNTFLGLGIVILAIGFLLRFVSPIEVFVEVWLFSLAGTIILGLGLLLVGTGFIRFLADANSVHSLSKKPISQKEFEKKYSEIGLANSSSGTQAIEALAKESKPLSRKEIAEKSGLSNTHAANALKSFVEKGYVLEFQVRGVFYYTIAQKGLRLCEDIKSSASVQKLIQSKSARWTLADSWLNKNKSPYYSEKRTGGSRRLLPKQKILLQQLVLIFGFLGGLYIHLGLNFGTLSTISVILTLTVFAWLATSILCARRVTGSLGIITLALACMAGYIVVVGEPFTSLGIMLLMSSTTLGAFAALYSRTHNPLQP